MLTTRIIKTKNDKIAVNNSFLSKESSGLLRSSRASFIKKLPIDHLEGRLSWIANKHPPEIRANISANISTII